MPPNKNHSAINKKRYRSYSKKDSNNLQKSKKQSKQIITKGQWSHNEDEILKEWVDKNGPKHWTKCALNIPGRTGKQCREHWNNSLNNEIIKGNWTVEEDYLIMVFYNKFNGSWKKMIPIFKSRTENSIKNRFFSQIRKIASKYIKTGKRVYSTKFGLDILLKYYEEGLDEAKTKYLKNNPMSEKELEEFINNIEILINSKPKEQKFIDFEQFRKNENNNSNINNKQISNSNKVTKELNENLNTITKKDENNDIKIDKQNQKKVDNENMNNTINPEESKTSIETFDIIINNNIKEDEQKIKEQKSKVEESNNNNKNGDEMNKSENKNTNFQNYDAKNDNNLNYLKKNNSNTVNYNINNNFNYNINNFNNNYFPNLNDQNNNINNIYNINNAKNNNIINNNGFNLNAFHIDRNYSFFGKQSSDLSEYIVNKDILGNNQGQNQNVSPTYVLNLLNSSNNSDNCINKEYSRMNSGNDPNYYMSINSGYINYPSGLFTNYYNTQNNERKNQFPKDQTNNFCIKRSDSIEYMKMCNNIPPNQYGYKKIPSFTFFKNENDNIVLPNQYGLKKLSSFHSFKLENDNNVFDESNKK